MSTIESMYNQSAVTKREGFVGSSTIKKAYVDYLDDFPCHVQPSTPSIAQNLPGAFGKEWIMFCPVADFKEGDKVIVDDVDEYRINGVETFNFGIDPHCEVTIRRFGE